MRVALVPDEGLHVGVHGSLVAEPPQGVAYKTMSATHTFLWPGSGRVPGGGLDIGEFVEVQADRWTAVHSASVPVMNAKRWVVDTDDLGGLVLCGKAGYSWRSRGTEEWTRDTSLEWGGRVVNVMAALLHPSCVAVLCRSHKDLHRCQGWLGALGAEAMSAGLASKAVVAYPAQAAVSECAFRAKWAQRERTIVYCGRDFAKKRGDVALAVFRRILESCEHVNCVYIGELPTELRAELSVGGKTIRWVERATQDEVRRTLEGAHVLVHPAASEALGVVFVEAAAAGMAVLCRSGEGFEQVNELFDGTSGAFCLSRQADVNEWCEAAWGAVEDDVETRRKATRNWLCARGGVMSIEARNETLVRAYQREAPPDIRPLRLSNLPVLAGTCTTATTRQVYQQLRAVTRQERPYRVVELDLDRCDVRGALQGSVARRQRDQETIEPWLRSS